VLEVIAKLAHESSLNNGLVVSLVIEYFDLLMRFNRFHHFLGSNGHIVLLLGGGYAATNRCQLLQLFHNLDALNEAASRIVSNIDGLQGALHFIEVRVYELVDDLGW
jgi:hypothetical protein